MHGVMICRFHTKDQCVIYYGLTLTIDVGGVYLHEVLVIHLDKTSQLSLITTMDSVSYQEPISLSWKVLTGVRYAYSSRFLKVIRDD